MTFGALIRDLRGGKDLTQHGLAAKVGVGFKQISTLENGKLEFGDTPSEPPSRLETESEIIHLPKEFTGKTSVADGIMIVE